MQQGYPQKPLSKSSYREDLHHYQPTVTQCRLLLSPALVGWWRPQPSRQPPGPSCLSFCPAVWGESHPSKVCILSHRSLISLDVLVQSIQVTNQLFWRRGGQYVSLPIRAEGDQFFTWADSDRTRRFLIKISSLYFDIRTKFLTQRVVSHWQRLPRDVMDAPLQEVFKARLDGASSSLISWMTALLTAGDWS